MCWQLISAAKQTRPAPQDALISIGIAQIAVILIGMPWPPRPSGKVCRAWRRVGCRAAVSRCMPAMPPAMPPHPSVATRGIRTSHQRPIQRQTGGSTLCGRSTAGLLVALCSFVQPQRDSRTAHATSCRPSRAGAFRQS
jgi:hypothetical protein